MAKNNKEKKPFYKRWWFWLIIILFVIGAINGNKDDEEDSKQQISSSQSQTQADKKKDKSSKSSDSSQSEAKTEADELKEQFEKSIGDNSVTFYKTVRNDTTKNWRLLVCYSSEDMKDHIVDYYKAYAEANNEVHFIVNLYLKTTTVINNFNGELFVDVHEYIDKEETDAKVLGGGMLLESYTVNLSTGKISELSSSSNS